MEQFCNSGGQRSPARRRAADTYVPYPAAADAVWFRLVRGAFRAPLVGRRTPRKVDGGRRRSSRPSRAGTVALHVDEIDIEVGPKVALMWPRRSHQPTVPMPGENRSRHRTGAPRAQSDKPVRLEASNQVIKALRCTADDCQADLPRGAKRLLLVVDNGTNPKGQRGAKGSPVTPSSGSSSNPPTMCLMQGDQAALKAAARQRPPQPSMVRRMEPRTAAPAHLLLVIQFSLGIPTVSWSRKGAGACWVADLQSRL